MPTDKQLEKFQVKADEFTKRAEQLCKEFDVEYVTILFVDQKNDMNGRVTSNGESSEDQAVFLASAILSLTHEIATNHQKSMTAFETFANLHNAYELGGDKDNPVVTTTVSVTELAQALNMDEKTFLEHIVAQQKAKKEGQH